MVAAIRSYPVRCVFCRGEGVFTIEDALDIERQEVATAIVQIAAKHSTVNDPVSPEDILGPRRTVRVADARHEAMWVLREHLALTFQRVGYYLNRDHSTVVHGVNQYRLRNDC